MTISDFNIRHLRAFCELVKTHNVSKAAERIHLSQPAVTQAIRKIETHLDADLFERSNAGLFANQNARLLYRRTLSAFSLLEKGIILAGRKAQTSDVQKQIHLVTSTHLRTLMAIQQARSFALATRQLSVSQSSLHRSARDLEQLLGIDLFSATHRGIELTEPAAILARFAKLANAEMRQAVDEINALKGKDTSRIMVGSMPLSRTSILPSATQSLLDENPDVQVCNVDGPYTELLHGLRHGDLDFLVGALRDPPPAEDVIHEVLFNDTLAVVSGKNHPLAGRTSLDRSDLLAFPWISAPSTTPTGMKTSEILGLDADNRDSPIRIISSSLVMIRGMLMRGNYLTLMSPRQLQVELQTGLVTILDTHLDIEERPIGLTFRKGWQPTPTQKAYIDLVRKAAGEYYPSQAPSTN
ncbi:LysR family transcriptional regulator [uncultured Cohaesibacter sp.]|uniref:LysR family transcriptional regulator n=1 Tax=uncultured Cohaesibacter sp. TaxID=1002546 RepID=UPI0029C7CCB8|nr:LysR family transcriptional regulator [uncultured Cohaesibacter sp.]